MATAKAPDRYSLIKSLSLELRKTYCEIDGQGRVSMAYEAKFDAADGDPCLKTEYRYASPTSSTVIGVKETHAEWDADFDTTAGFTT
jgi:hypothetical protein